MTMLNKHAITATLAGALMIGTATASLAAQRHVGAPAWASAEVAARPYDSGYGQTYAPAGGQVAPNQFSNGCVSDEGYGRYRDCDSGGTGG